MTMMDRGGRAYFPRCRRARKGCNSPRLGPFESSFGQLRMPSTKPSSKSHANFTSSGLLATNLPLLPPLLQLPVALRVDLLLAPSQHVLRCDVARRAVQPNIVVVVHVSAYQTPRIIERQRCSWPDALPFERFVPALDLSVRLRIKRRGSDVRHARDPDELFEVLGDELRPVVGDDPGLRLRVKFLGALHDDFDVRL